MLDLARATNRAPGAWPRCYAAHLDAFVLDTVDADQAPAIEALGLRTLVTDTIMRDDDGRARLAREVLDFVAPPPSRPTAADDATEPDEPASHRAVTIAAIIPVGNLEGAKTRLGEIARRRGAA